MVEGLESRVLMSATTGQVSAAVNAFHSDERKVVADEKKLKAGLLAVSKTLAADLKSAGAAGTGQPLLNSAVATGKGLITNFAAAFNTHAGPVLLGAKKVGVDGKQLLKHPTNTTLAQKVSADISALTTTCTNAAQAVGAFGGWSGLDTGLSAVAQADLTNVKLSNDIAAGRSSLSTLEQKLDLDESTVVLGDLIRLEILFSS